MSSRCRLARLVAGVVVSVKVVEDDSGQAAFEAAQRFWIGGARIESFAVVGATEAIEADLGHGDTVQGGVELTIARAGQPHPPGGVARPHRYWGHPGMTGKGCLAFEPADSGGLSDEFGRGQLPAAGKSHQYGRHLTNPIADALGQSVDGFGEPGDVGQLVASQL